MELKSAELGDFNVEFVGSNRTFMELKYFERHKPQNHHKVLIAPLWN